MILAFVLIPLLQKELNTFKDTIWNTHRIRQQRDTELPNGVPNHIYAFPEEYGFADCGKFTKIDIALNRYNVCQNHLSNSLRWLDTVFKKLSYSLLNTLNFRTVKFK